MAAGSKCSTPARFASTPPLIFAIVLLLCSGCRSTTARVESLTNRGLFEQALQVLEEEGAGIVPRPDVGDDALEARVYYERRMLEAYGSMVERSMAEGRVRAAQQEAAEGSAHCPWSEHLTELRVRLTETLAQLDSIERSWEAWGVGPIGENTADARALAHDLQPVLDAIADSPRLRELLEAAQTVLVDHWVGALRNAGGCLDEDEEAALALDFELIPECGAPVRDLVALLRRFRRLFEQEAALGLPVAELAREAHELAMALGEAGIRASVLAPLTVAARAGLREWLVSSLPPLLDVEGLDFEAVSEAEGLVDAFPNSNALAEAVALGHVRRAEELGGGGVTTLLAKGHIQRALQLGMAPDNTRLERASTRVSAALRATQWPELTISVEPGPDVEPWMQDFVSLSLMRGVLGRSVGWARWRWVDSRLDVPDVLLVIDAADLVITPIEDLALVGSSYFSHFQDVPNPNKSSLELQLRFAEGSMNSAESSYNSAVSSHNIYPTQWSLAGVNRAYDTYVYEVNHYNALVAQYNATPSMISEKVYMPYSFREGEVSFGWALGVSLRVGDLSRSIVKQSIVRDHARLGTRRDDRAKERRRDDPVDIEISANAGVEHLVSVIGDVCDELSVMLDHVEYDALLPLEADEALAMAGLLNPLGLDRHRESLAGLPEWLAESVADLDLEPITQSAAVISLALPPEPPPVRASPRQMADWYEGVLCEVRASDRDIVRGHGSGVLVSGDGLVLTCAHVLLGPLLSVRIHAGEWAGEYEAVPYFVDQREDVAILRVRNLRTTRWAPLRLDLAAVHGEAIVAMGNPGLRGGGTSYGSITAGIVANPAVDRFGSTVLVADVNVSSGSSGGPLISLEDGAVVGVVQMVAEAGFGDVASTGFSCLAAPAMELGAWLGLQYGSGKLAPGQGEVR